jgi:SPP1 family predicted phage head-tail adaptor
MESSKLDQRLTIEKPSVAQDASFGAESVTWSTLATVWGKVADVVNTRRGGEETVEQNVRVRSSLTQITIRYRSDVTTDMRIQWTARGRTLQIVGMAELGRRDGLQLSCEQFTV